jgi:N-acetylmuramoyl-L-alanine amidase
MSDGRLQRAGTCGLPFVLGIGLALMPASIATAQQIAAVPGATVHISRAEEPDIKCNKAGTRFEIGLERSIDFQIFVLRNPNRVIVELPDVKLQLPAFTEDQSVGLVKSFRGGLSAPGKARVVIDVSCPVVVEKADVEKDKNGETAKLVLEIIPSLAGASSEQKHAFSSSPDSSSPDLSLSAVGVQPPFPKPAVRPAVRAARLFRPVIVIDPGHGGIDSGAQKFGTVEKDVVLAFSLKLRNKLESTGRYKVLMTRETDVFVELDERRAFAERNKAALFIAVHADYAGSSARGATIYSLRESVAKELQRSAKGETSDHLLSGRELAAVRQIDSDVGTVKGILADLALREVQATKERTSVFARSVIEYMGESTSLQNNPDRSAAFRVLKTAQMPSVLIELAYVSNRSDAALLKSDIWREKVSNSIVTAVDNYFSYRLARLPM